MLPEESFTPLTLSISATCATTSGERLVPVDLGMLYMSTGIFTPPTLTASLYGMNFAYMPELAWHYGYPLALILMLASASGTYLFFKWKRWL